MIPAIMTVANIAFPAYLSGLKKILTKNNGGKNSDSITRRIKP